MFAPHMQYRRKTVITTRNVLLYSLNEIRYDKAGKTISILCNDNKYELFEFICLFIYSFWYFAFS